MSFCMPIRPTVSEPCDEELLCPLCDEQDGWERPEESGMALDQNGIVDAMDGVDEVDESGGVIQLPKGLPAPTLPSKSEIELHNLTHIPYRNWCPHCVAARRKNDPHLLSLDERTVPLFVADYCFLGDEADEDLCTTLVGRVFPSRALIAVPCESKGHDEYSVHRLRSFLKAEGVTQLVYKSD